METLGSQDISAIPVQEKQLQVFTLTAQFLTPSRLEAIMACSDSLIKVTGIMARILRHGQEQQMLRGYRAARDTPPLTLTGTGNSLNFAELACLL